MANGIGAIDGINNGQQKGKVDYLEKLKKYQEQMAHQAGKWTNGYNVNQLPGMLSEGNLGTAASQG